MPSPRSLTYALYTHWDVVESLVVLTREVPIFDTDMVLKVIARNYPDMDMQAWAEALRGMVSSDLLRVVARSDALELHPQVVEFVRGLAREHELGLSDVLRARVDVIKAATAKLVDGLAENKADQLRSSAQKLSELFRQIAQQLDNDLNRLGFRRGSAV